MTPGRIPIDAEKRLCEQAYKEMRNAPQMPEHCESDDGPPNTFIMEHYSYRLPMECPGWRGKYWNFGGLD
jgi:hypothetical protein